MKAEVMEAFRGSQLKHGGGERWDRASRCPRADYSPHICSIHLDAPAPQGAQPRSQEAGRARLLGGACEQSPLQYRVVKQPALGEETLTTTFRKRQEKITSDDLKTSFPF